MGPENDLKMILGKPCYSDDSKAAQQLTQQMQTHMSWITHKLVVMSRKSLGKSMPTVNLAPRLAARMRTSACSISI